MTFDISRSTFNSWNDYFGVVMQQGRVHLDSDWNELLAEFTRRIHAGTLDIVGLSGTPSTTPGAFQISVTPADANGDIHVTIGVGRMYVDGILVENHGSGAAPLWDPALADYAGSPGTPMDFTAQPYVHGATLPALGTGPYLVYLDVWRADINYLQDANLIDPAVGIDTTGRVRSVWQVRLLDVSAVAGGFVGSTPDSALWSAAQPTPEGALWQVLTTGSPSMLTTGPAFGYTGQENQLYRVEIHESGNAGSAATLPLTYPLPAGTATFKWSRENASVATAVSAIASVTNSLGATASKLTVQSMGRDQVLGFAPGDWIEMTDDFLALSAEGPQPGELHQIDSINLAAMTITLDAPVNAASFPLTNGLTDPLRHTRITRWDQQGTVYLADGQTVWANLSAAADAGIPVPPSGTSLLLKDGVTVAFDLNGPGTFQAGDYWTFAARTADGSVAPLTKALPFGTAHHVSRLAILDLTTTPPAVMDCRTVFQSLANRAIHVMGVNPVSGVQFVSGGTINVQDLVQGLSVTFDSPIDPAVGTSSLAPPCFITAQMPDSPSSGGWFNTVVLAGVVTVNDRSTRSITWMPTSEAITALTAQIVPGTRVLACLTLKGGAIWALGGPPYMYLNGAGVADGRASADFEMWFSVTSLPPVALSATALTYAATTVGTSSAAQPITVTNTTQGDATFSSAISVTGPNAADFVMTTTCDTDLAAGASCSISVAFAPKLMSTLQSTRTASISIADSLDQNPQSISLSGTALAPWLSASSTGLSFPTTIIGQASFLNITVVNTGTAPLTISKIQIVAVGAVGNAAHPAKSFDAKLHEVVAKVADAKLSDKTAESKLQESAPKLTDMKLADKTVEAKLQETAPKLTEVKLTDKAIESKLQETAPKLTDNKVLLENLPPPVVVTVGFGDFSETSSFGAANAGTLQPGQQCIITVGFQPSAIGARAGVLQITHNAATAPLAINLAGSGTLQIIKIREVKLSDKLIDKVISTSLNPVVHPAAKVGGAGRKAFITPRERPPLGSAGAHKEKPKAKTVRPKAKTVKPKAKTKSASRPKKRPNR